MPMNKQSRPRSSKTFHLSWKYLRTSLYISRPSRNTPPFNEKRSNERKLVSMRHTYMYGAIPSETSSSQRYFSSVSLCRYAIVVTLCYPLHRPGQCSVGANGVKEEPHRVQAVMPQYRENSKIEQNYEVLTEMKTIAQTPSSQRKRWSTTMSFPRVPPAVLWKSTKKLSAATMPRYTTKSSAILIAGTL